jgi:protocatechuate 3,4-dioxygenase beta subunit
MLVGRAHQEPAMPQPPTRRRFLLSSMLAATGFAVVPIGRAPVLAQPRLPPTPSCGDAPTLRQTEGPFYLPRSPQRSDLREPGAARSVELSGVVLTRACRPVAGALVDLWHADDKGDYDARGFRYRGHQFTDTEGRYRFRTIVPAVYPGRTRHYHVKVQAPAGAVLTTQLYFPDEPMNRRDGLFRRELLMRTADAGKGLDAHYDFVIEIG